MTQDDDLAHRRCRDDAGALNEAQCARYLARLAGWVRDGARLERCLSFRDHYEAVAFVNAVAWISHREDHHPEITLGYRDVRITYWTHSVNGLSENDFICAAKVDSLLTRSDG